jgi:hypothetical protein
VFVNVTVFAPAARAKEGMVSWPPEAVSVTAVPPLTEAVVLQPLPLGAASETLQLDPATAPVSVGVAEAPLASAAVVKLDGQVPL